MIPGGSLSSQALPSLWAFGNPQPSLRESRHIGGVGIGDASQGLRVKVWTCTTDGTSVFIGDGTPPPAVLFNGTGITEVSHCFDQNMNPFVAFVDASGSRFRWFDPQVSAFVITALPAGSLTPRCTLDDNRVSQSASSDIILSYVRGGVLHYRQQRDRFGLEYTLQTGLFSTLRAIGMSDTLRLQFQVGITPS